MSEVAHEPSLVPEVAQEPSFALFMDFPATVAVLSLSAMFITGAVEVAVLGVAVFWFCGVMDILFS